MRLRRFGGVKSLLPAFSAFCIPKNTSPAQCVPGEAFACALYIRCIFAMSSWGVGVVNI